MENWHRDSHQSVTAEKAINGRYDKLVLFLFKPSANVVVVHSKSAAELMSHPDPQPHNVCVLNCIFLMCRIHF